MQGFIQGSPQVCQAGTDSMCPKCADSPMGLENPRGTFFFLVMPTHFPRSWAALESQGSILVHQIPELGSWE